MGADRPISLTTGVQYDSLTGETIARIGLRIAIVQPVGSMRHPGGPWPLTSRVQLGIFEDTNGITLWQCSRELDGATS